MGRGGHILAIDHGTSGVKAALVTLDGQIVDFAFEPTSLCLDDGGATQDPGEWWSALVKASRRVVIGRDVEAVCISSTWSTTVAVDSSGMHIADAMTWLDARGAPHVRKLARGLINVRGYGLGKMIKWIRLTGGGPTLSGKDDIAHVLYLKNERPDVYAAADKFLSPKDYLNGRLCGRVVATPDSVCLFWVTDNRDLSNVTYHPGLLEAAGIDGAKLPPIVPSTELLGEVTEDVAEEIGLGSGVKVVAGSPDLQSACVGSGAVRDFEGHVYVGTSSWILCHVPFKKTDAFHSIASLPSAIPGRYFCANEQDTAGGCLTFLRDCVFFDGNAPTDCYEIFDRMVEKVPAGANGVMFMPWLNGEKTPVDDEHLGATFLNMGIQTTRPDLIRAVFEGVALNNRWVLGYVEKFIGRRMEHLNIIGGGARSDVWCQIFADVLGREIRKVVDPIGANARGAALIAAVALGHTTFDSIEVPIEKTFFPQSDNIALFDELFAEFLAFHKANRGFFHRVNGRA